jgi:hypothetical protein
MMGDVALVRGREIWLPRGVQILPCLGFRVFGPDANQALLTVATKRGLRPTAIPDITAQAPAFYVRRKPECGTM